MRCMVVSGVWVIAGGPWVGVSGVAPAIGVVVIHSAGGVKRPVWLGGAGRGLWAGFWGRRRPDGAGVNGRVSVWRGVSIAKGLFG